MTKTVPYIFLIFLGLLTKICESAPTAATVYEKDSNHQKELYRWKRSEQGDAESKIVKMAFYDLQGKTVATEDAVFEKGKLKTYSVEHFQLNENGKLEVNAKKIHFEYTRNGKTETNDEDLPPNLVVVPTVIDYLEQNWLTLEKGKNVSVRLAVLDRRETVGFEFFELKDKETPETITIKMKPSSIFIAAIVDPLFFTFDKTSKKLKEVIGRTLPKQKIDDKWRDLDADVVYRY